MPRCARNRDERAISQPLPHTAETAAGDLRTLRREPLVRVIGCGDEGDVLPVVLAIELAEDLPDPLRAGWL